MVSCRLKTASPSSQSRELEILQPQLTAFPQIDLGRRSKSPALQLMEELS